MYTVERTTDNGLNESYLTANAQWTTVLDDALTFHDLAEAQQLAEDFADYAATKGTGYLFNIREVDRPASISLVPSWETAARIYATALQAGTPEGQQSGLNGVLDMGQRMDKLIHRLTIMEANQ